MNYKTLIIGIVVFIVFIIGGFCFYSSLQTSSEDEKHPYSEITYDDCLNGGKDPTECKKYIGTRNAEMEQGFVDIMNEVVQEQSQEGVLISFEEIKVINLGERLQGL